MRRQDRERMDVHINCIRLLGGNAHFKTSAAIFIGYCAQISVRRQDNLWLSTLRLLGGDKHFMKSAAIDITWCDNTSVWAR